jgi:hypothetical protein
MSVVKSYKGLAGELGIETPRGSRDTALSIRLTDADARKLDLLAKKLGVRGRSTMARLILEKFISDHVPERRGKR